MTTYEFVVVANRLPVTEVTDDASEVTGDGDSTWKRNPSGLVTALYPVVQRQHGVWIGWPGRAGPVPPPFDDAGVMLHPIELSDEDVDEYHEGQANGTIWPLYHDAVEQPEFHRRWRQAYHRVNLRFARAAAALAAPGATVWVHDYHLQLVPGMLRDQRPDLRIGFFLHIPFPPIELFCQMPLRADLIRGMLGADLVGFQRPMAAHNFLRLAHHLLGLSSRGNRVEWNERTVTTGAFPVSIDTAEIQALAADPAVRERAAEIRTELGNPRTVILGVDSLDYTKGIEQRLEAYRELLAERRLDPTQTVLIQVAVPSRQRLAAYRELRGRIEREVGRINGRHAEVGRSPVHYLHRSFPRDELVALYLAADVMAVTPLRAGMNLVAKEYVAAQLDDDGALVLSEFTGAATELKQAYLVNPHDIDELKDALVQAASTPLTERRPRIRAMRRQVQKNDIVRWADSFLAALHHASARGAVVRPRGPEADAGTQQDGVKAFVIH